MEVEEPSTASPSRPRTSVPDDIQTPQIISAEIVDPGIPTVTPFPFNSNSTGSSELLEERYNKLKGIAVKLKKRIAEQNAEIESLKGDKPRLQNASKIQQEFDKAQDEIEKLKKSEALLNKDLEQAIEENVRLKMTDFEANSQIQNLSTSHKVLREKLDRLERESGDAQELKIRVETLEKELKEAKDAGQDAQQEKRQLQMLSLEVTDYEKKLQDAYGSAEEKKVECEGLRRELNLKDAKIDELDSRISNYKGTENQLILAKESLQADATRKADKIAFLQDEVTKVNERLAEKKSEHQKLEQEFETAKTTFASQVKELMDKCANSEKIIFTLEQKILTLEDNKRSRETHVANLKLEMQQLESDYSNYKVKAQTMLKSQKPKTQVQERDEVENLQRVVQDFHSEISILKSELQTMKLENENLLMEKADLNVRINQIRIDATEKEIQLGSELQKLKIELRQKDELLKTRLEGAKSDMESCIVAFKVQMESLKADYEAQIQVLREQYELLKYSGVVTSSRENPGIDSAVHTNVNGPEGQVHFMVDNHNNDSPSSAFRPVIAGRSPPASETSREGLGLYHNHTVSQPLIIETGGMSFDQLRMIPRGEGEGSESVTSAYTPRADKDYNMSFEQLLSSSFDSNSKNSDSDLEKTTRDSVNLKEEVVKSQSQVNHLTALVRESEANCDRLAQLCDALKEEIRRIERDKERQEHLKENTEYLKNVLLKFVTLNGGDERQRLIPVLKTMLRLTTEEVGTLENVVKGKEGNSKDGSSWSSYLPIWSNSPNTHK